MTNLEITFEATTESTYNLDIIKGHAIATHAEAIEADGDTLAVTLNPVHVPQFMLDVARFMEGVRIVFTRTV